MGNSYTNYKDNRRTENEAIAHVLKELKNERRQKQRYNTVKQPINHFLPLKVKEAISNVKPAE